MSRIGAFQRSLSAPQLRNPNAVSNVRQERDPAIEISKEFKRFQAHMAMWEVDTRNPTAVTSFYHGPYQCIVKGEPSSDYTRNMRRSDGDLPIHYAVRRGDIALVQDLLRAGAHVEDLVEVPFDESLHGIVSFVTREGDDRQRSHQISCREQNAITLAMDCCPDNLAIDRYLDNLALSALLIGAGSPDAINVNDGQRRTPLMRAIELNLSDHVDLLIDAHVDVNQPDLKRALDHHSVSSSLTFDSSKGLSPLLLAASLGRSGIFDALLKARAQLQDPVAIIDLTINGWLKNPGRSGSYELILDQLLSGFKRLLNQPSAALRFAASQLRTAFCRAFIEGLRPAGIENEDGEMIRDDVEEDTRRAMFDMVLEKAPTELGFLSLGGRIDRKSMDRTASWTLISNFETAAKIPAALRLYFTEHGVAPDVIDQLYAMKVKCSLSLIQMLCEFPIDLDREIRPGYTPLQWAISDRDATADDVGEILRAHRKLPDRADLLELAIKRRDPGKVKLLLEWGADPNRSSNGRSPLQWVAAELPKLRGNSAETNMAEIVGLLVNSGADMKDVAGPDLANFYMRNILQ